MKTIPLIPLLAMMALTGCGDHSTGNASNPGGEPAANQPSPAPASTNEMVNPGNGVATNAPAVTNGSDANNPMSTNQ